MNNNLASPKPAVEKMSESLSMVGFGSITEVACRNMSNLDVVVIDHQENITTFPSLNPGVRTEYSYGNGGGSFIVEQRKQQSTNDPTSVRRAGGVSTSTPSPTYQWTITADELMNNEGIYIEDCNVVVALAANQHSVRHPKRTIVTDEYVRELINANANASFVSVMISCPPGHPLMKLQDSPGIFASLSGLTVQVLVVEDALATKPEARLFTVINRRKTHEQVFDMSTLCDQQVVTLNDTDRLTRFGVAIGKPQIDRFIYNERIWYADLKTNEEVDAILKKMRQAQQIELDSYEDKMKNRDDKHKQDLAERDRVIEEIKRDRDYLRSAATQLSEDRDRGYKEQINRTSFDKAVIEREKSQHDVAASIVKYAAAIVAGGLAVFAALRK